MDEEAGRKWAIMIGAAWHIRIAVNGKMLRKKPKAQ